MSDLSNIKALAFDVGGTVIDWHGGVSAQLRAYGEANGIEADWPAVTNDWRKRLLTLVLDSLTSDLPRGNIDGAHRKTLDETLAAFAIDGVSEADRDEMAYYWHHLDPWPDSASGHARLRGKFIMSTLTILSISLIIDVSRRAPFLWDAVISCEMLDRYKLHPSVYRRGAELLQLEPGQVMMVAAHNFDLNAARAAGMRTAFIRRPIEWGDGTTPEQELDREIDIIADGLDDLADQLGA